MVRWVVMSILHDGPIELFLVPASARHLVQQKPWHVLSCRWGDAYKRSLASNQVAHVVVAAGFMSRYMNGPLPYVQCHVTILKCVESVVK